MTKGEFSKIDATDTLLYGPRKMVLSGYASRTQSEFKTLLDAIGIFDLPLVWACAPDANSALAEIFDLPDGTGEGRSSDLPQAIVVGGITQNELHSLMSGSRQAGLRPPLWAVLTPTSEKWPLVKLLAELEAERRFMQQRTANKK